jgi:methylmalonyl-CoA mutase N-terminal domain/subunit
MGGAVKAIEAGWMQAQIGEAAYKFQQEVERGERVIVGVNKYSDEADQKQERGMRDEGRGARFVVDPAVEMHQRERLAQWRANRDNEAVSGLLARLRAAAQSTENLMPILIACVEGGATVGEIGKVLRGVFGEYRAPMTI